MYTIDFPVSDASMVKEFDHALRNIIIERMTNGDFDAAHVINNLAQHFLRRSFPETTFAAGIADQLQIRLTDEQKNMLKEDSTIYTSFTSSAEANTAIQRIVHHELENDCATFEQSVKRAENVFNFILNCKKTNDDLNSVIFDPSLLDSLSSMTSGRLSELRELAKQEQEREVKDHVNRVLTK